MVCDELLLYFRDIILRYFRRLVLFGLQRYYSGLIENIVIDLTDLVRYLAGNILGWE